MSQIRIRSTNRALGMALSMIAPSMVIALAGCGGMTMNTPNPGPTGAAQSMTQVKIGDAPADRVVSFEVTVGPITLTPDSGSPVTVLSGTQHLELTHLSGTNEMLSMLKVPQGSYKSATIGVANPEVSFINSQGKVQKIEPAFNQSLTISLSPSLVIGGSSTVINLDLNVAQSVTVDAQGNVTGVNLSASSFTVGSATVAAEGKQHDDDGELEDTTGMISAVNGSSFNLAVGGSGTVLTFATDGNTEFKDGASLTVNSIVTVEGSTRSDGSLYAKKVEGVESENGAEADGLITAVAGLPATGLTVVADHGMGSGMDDTKLGETLTSDVSQAVFEVKQGNVDTSGIGTLPVSPDFPFDATTVHAGQRVELETKDRMNGMSLSAEKVRLQQQALVGAVSGLSGSTSSGPVTFTLTLPADSAFAMLSGKTQVMVFWQPGTELRNLSSVGNGDTVRVRGLVFFTGSSFNMIARRIDK